MNIGVEAKQKYLKNIFMTKKGGKYNKARVIKESTLKRLFALSGNECAFNHNGFNCTEKIVFDENSDMLKTQICHIEAAEKGGQRYNKDSNDDYRRSFENLILLCPNHHIETNDTQIFTVDVLKKMKREHEVQMLQKISTQNIITKYPSALNIVISHVGSKLFPNPKPDDLLAAPDPEKKISHNNISEYKPIIDAYKVYQGRLNKIYQEIENQGSTRKEIVLKNINTIYLREKGKYSNFDEIRNNADNIIKSIENELWEIIENSNNKNENMPIEAIQMSLLIIMVDAFMRCEILEEPPSDDS